MGGKAVVLLYTSGTLNLSPDMGRGPLSSQPPSRSAESIGVGSSSKRETQIFPVDFNSSPTWRHFVSGSGTIDQPLLFSLTQDIPDLTSTVLGPYSLVGYTAVMD